MHTEDRRLRLRIAQEFLPSQHVEHPRFRRRGQRVSVVLLLTLEHPHVAHSFSVIMMLPLGDKSPAGEGLDLRTLRAVRVLRPLKLVSGVPSKCGGYSRDQQV